MKLKILRTKQMERIYKQELVLKVVCSLLSFSYCDDYFYSKTAKQMLTGQYFLLGLISLNQTLANIFWKEQIVFWGFVGQEESQGCQGIYRKREINLHKGVF